METIRTTDNNCGRCSIEIDTQIKDLSLIGNKSLFELETENPDFLVFPSSLFKTQDKIGETPIFSIHNEKILTTFNLMGFIGVNQTQLAISSRFNKTGDDYFLHYMLQKVFMPSLVNLKFETDQENIWDIFLIYLFPYYLKKAMNQGLYKEYVKEKHNDANLKGVIDIHRHVQVNIPFTGTIAYKTREHNFDNRMTQLIRHTQEYIKSRSFSIVLNGDKETRAIVNLINFNTSSYNRFNRHKIIQNNLKRIDHPFYTEYEILRKICLKILRGEGLNYGKHDRDKVYGLVFDGAWLWEEYLNTLLGENDFIHPENKNKKKGICLFKESNNFRFPDFYSKDKVVVLDAKYKVFENWNPNNENNTDVYQVITYLHCLEAKIGGFIFPLGQSDTYHTNQCDVIGELLGYGGILYKLGLLIPTNSASYLNFIETIQRQETFFQNIISNFLLRCPNVATYPATCSS